MSPQTFGQRQRVKAAVRWRDRYRCRGCGMRQAEHRGRYGKSLDVHRVIPGSLYTVAGCVTLCKDCHYARPGRQAGEADLAYGPRTSWAVSLPAAYHAVLKSLAAQNRRPLTRELRLALDQWVDAHALKEPD
jgi:hypothetical protein